MSKEGERVKDNRAKVLILVLILLTTLLSGCNFMNNMLGKQYSVTFSVTDGSKGVQDAVISIGTDTAKTDSAGKAIISQLKSGTYELTITKVGYKTHQETLVINDNVLHAVVLNPETYTVTFNVSDAVTEAPLQNASVTLANQTILTNENGIAVFNELTLGNYSYQVCCSDYEARTGSVGVTGQNITETVSLTPVVNEYNLTFVVVDEQNIAVPEAQINLVNHGTFLTDNTGKVTITQLRAGDYDYTMSKVGFHETSGQAQIIDHDETITIQLSAIPPTYTVLFRVDDGKTGAVLQGATIHFAGQTKITDTQGEATFIGIQAGCYSLSVQKTGYEDITNVLNIGNEDTSTLVHLNKIVPENQALSLNPIGNKSIYEKETLTFTVSATDPDGDNLTYRAEGDLVEMFNPETQTFSWTPAYGTAKTYTITFIVSDGDHEDREVVTITVSKVVYRVSGRVTDHNDAGIPGVKINFGNTFASVLTDQNGYWEKTGLSGSVVVTAQHDDYLFQPKMVEVDGTKTDINFVGMLQLYPITFIISSSQGGKVGGAEIILGNITKITDAQGIAVFDLPNGTYSYTITANAHKSYQGQSLAVFKSKKDMEVLLTYQPSTWSSRPSFSGAWTREFWVNLMEIKEAKYFELFYIGTISEIRIGQRKPISESLRCFEMYFQNVQNLEVRFFQSSDSFEVLGAARLVDLGGLAWQSKFFKR